MVEKIVLDEGFVLKCLGVENVKELKKILSKNLGIPYKEIEIEYDNKKKGSFKINGGIPFNKLEDGCQFGQYSPEERKRIFYGLPIVNPLIKYDRPVGGDVCAYTKLFEEYPMRRSNRLSTIKPVGFDEENNLIDKFTRRKGHILFAWLVDRFFHKMSFSPNEKLMMTFTQSIWSNEAKEIPNISLEGESKFISSQYHYEMLLKEYLEKEVAPFKIFRYSVLLIYKDKDTKIPIATLLQLDTDNPKYRFNALVPNVDYVITTESN